MPCPEFLILSRATAEAYEPTGVEVCISISNPEAPEMRLSSKFRDVLRLTFTDIAKPSPYHFDILFGEEHAEKILAFVQRWRSADRIVIHCLAGISRSPSVAMGLCEVFGWPLTTLESDHPLWNTWVRAELVRVGSALGITADERRGGAE